jgi:hypothetical protein
LTRVFDRSLIFEALREKPALTSALTLTRITKLQAAALWEPLVRRLLGPALEGVAMEHGIAGATPGSAAANLAIGQLQFDSVETCERGPSG